MYSLAAYRIIAAPLLDRDDAGWMQLLVFVLVAVIIGIKSMLQARRGQHRQAAPEEQEPPGAAKAAAGSQGRAAVGSGAKRVRPRPVASGPGPRQPATISARAVARGAAGTVGPGKPLGLRRMPELAQAKFGIPEMAELPEITAQPMQKLEPTGTSRLQEPSAAGHLPDLMLDYSDPEALRRAILHYEILGPPLSLRPPSG